VGMLLGAIGRGAGVASAGSTAFYLIALLASLLAAREWGWIAFRLPERKCQTEKVWAHEFGFVFASAMWGIHIGLGFATRVTYGGFWVIVALALALGNPAFGALLMLLYWLGRAMPLWVAPALTRSGPDPTELPEMILADRLVFHRLVGSGLVGSAATALLLALRGHASWPFNFVGSLLP